MGIIVFKDLLTSITAIGAKGSLFLIAPLATIMNDNNQSTILIKPEMISLLEKYGKLKSFEEGNEYCKCCNSPLSFDNLGLIIEKKDLEMTCDNPGCTLKV